jgi:hypothetical protein
MTNIKQRISEVEKGCGKDCFVKDEFGDEDLVTCGEYLIKKSTERKLKLCLTCQATLQILKSCEEEITKLQEEKEDCDMIKEFTKEFQERLKKFILKTIKEN